MPELKLYSESATIGDGGEVTSREHPAFMWGVGVQLTALASAAAVEPEPYRSQMLEYADAIQVYWLEHDGIAGFDVQPGPKSSDRYYDDNAWLVLALAEVYECTNDKKYLERAADTFRFVMSGEDEKLGGGLYWREKYLTSKNTCTNAPAIVSALRLHQLTGDPDHLETARRIYRWTCDTLQDEDGLFHDNVRMDGRVDRRKFSYNSALMIRANCLLHTVTGEEDYLEEARRIARAAKGEWVSENGAVADSGRFAHLLLESFLALDALDRDSGWSETVTTCLVHLHGSVRDENGRYPHHWARRRPGSGNKVALLDQASPARIYWLAADRIGRQEE